MTEAAKTWSAARFAHDGTLRCRICEAPPREGIVATGAAIPPPLRNPSGGDTWYHGTNTYFTHPETGEEQRDDGGELEREPYRDGGDYGDNAGHHWNTDLGVHFTSDKHVARAFATGSASNGSHERSADKPSRVLHAGLHMANPIRFEDEREMGKAAIEWAHANGHHFLDPGEEHHHQAFLDGDYDEIDHDHRDYSYLHEHGVLGPSRRHSISRIAKDGVEDHRSLDDVDSYLRFHPDREEITDGWAHHLREKGHDGIVYGNSYEGPKNHPCAIAFPETAVHHRRWQWLHEDKQHLNDNPGHDGQKTQQVPGQERLPNEHAPGWWHRAKREPLTFEAFVTAASEPKGCYYYPDHEHEHTPSDDPDWGDECPYESQHTDWSHHYPRLGQHLFRGVSDALHPDAHDESLPMHHRAQKVLDSIHDGHSGLGTHWTTDHKIAHQYSMTPNYQPGGGHEGQSPVIIHAHTPDLENIDQDPDSLQDQQTFGYDKHDDQEVPFQKHAPISVHGVSWLKSHDHPDRYHPDNWAHHTFSEPMYFDASLQHTAGRSEDIDALGRSEHPNVDRYISGGIGHRGEDRSVVGFLPTHLVRSYREHGGDWNPDSAERVQAIREDLRSGKGLTNPVQMEYDHDLGWGYVGEGNHRVEAAHQEGTKTVPVRVYGRASLGRQVKQGIGGPMHFTGDFTDQGAPEGYMPPDVHPHHFTYPGGKTHAYDYHDGRWASKTAVLDDEGRISVAESIMEAHGHSGRSWHVPRMHVDDPRRPQAHKPVHDFVHSVLTGAGWSPGGEGHSIRVQPHHWDLREKGSGQAITDGLNYIGLKGEDANDLTLLHECAHIVHGTGEGQGHGPGFRDTVSSLYRQHLGDEAADLFDRFSVPPKTAVLDDWRPTERLFAPTKGGLDPRLFRPDRQMLAPVRQTILAKTKAFFAAHGWFQSPECVRVYLAGSQASEWYGNNDFDILVGINYADFRERNPWAQALSDAEIGTALNLKFREDFNDEQWLPAFDPEHEWHLTGYVFRAERDKFMPHNSVLVDSLDAWHHHAGSPPSSRIDSSRSTEMKGSPRPTSPQTSASAFTRSAGTSTSPGSPETHDVEGGRWSEGARRRAGSAAPQKTFGAADALAAPERRTGSTTSPEAWGSPSSSTTPHSNAKTGSAPSAASQGNAFRWITTTPAALGAEPVAGAFEDSSARGAIERLGSSATKTSRGLLRTSSNAPDPYDTMDIRNIKPYAAYNVTDDVWAVNPIHEPEGHRFNESEWYYFEGIAAQVRGALALKEPVRTQRCSLLWEFIHADRSRAFGPHGTGAFDRGNALEKYLDQAPSGIEGKSLMAALADVRFGRQVTAGAAGQPPAQMAWQVLHDVDWNTARAYHHPGGPEIGKLVWHPSTGEVATVSVHPDHQRRGVASFLWEKAKESDPRLHHSNSLTEDGAAWAQVTASTGVTYHHVQEPNSTVHQINAHDGDDQIGHLSWQDGFGDRVGTVHVDERYRRRGVATEMMRRAREINPALRHSQWLTDDGEAWAQHVGSTQTLYHGSNADLADGETLTPRGMGPAQHVWLTSDPEEAKRYGQHVYVVSAPEATARPVPGRYVAPSAQVIRRHAVEVPRSVPSVAASVPYFVAEGGGKYHRINPITGQAACRGTILCDRSSTPMHVPDDATRVHPIVCRRCLGNHPAVTKKEQ